MANPKEPMGGDEFIDASEVEFVPRGKKSSVDPAIVAKLAILPAGKAYPMRSLALDPNDENYRNAKTRVTSVIRNACAHAGLVKFSVRWSPSGVPQVINNGR